MDGYIILTSSACKLVVSSLHESGQYTQVVLASMVVGRLAGQAGLRCSLVGMGARISNGMDSQRWGQ